MKRYPLESLIAAMGMSANQACLTLGLSGSTQQEYRTRGVTERVADRLAVKAGFIAYEVWPELVDDAIEQVEVDCARHDCGEQFVPSRDGHTFCSERCNRLVRQRRYRATRRGAAAARASAAAYYADHGDYVRARERRRYAERRSA